MGNLFGAKQKYLNSEQIDKICGETALIEKIFNKYKNGDGVCKIY
jgi:hypothetical protein